MNFVQSLSIVGNMPLTVIVLLFPLNLKFFDLMGTFQLSGIVRSVNRSEDSKLWEDTKHNGSKHVMLLDF